MKKRIVCLVLLVLAADLLLAVDRSEILQRAAIDAIVDGKDIHGFWVGLGVFGVSLLSTPMVGLVFTLAAYSWKAVDVPAGRLDEVRNACDDPALLDLYAGHYRETLTRIGRRKFGGASVAGTGAALAVYAGLVVYLMLLMGGPSGW